tara:strand:+ start:2156 stop:2569 length:414 start_codon:yes stop_codon:yes gene_type:complete
MNVLPDRGYVATTRTGRLLTVGILLSFLLLAMLIQAQPLPQITVDEMLDESSEYENNEVHVRGVVKPQSISEDGNMFILAGVESEVYVDATGIAMPEGLMEGTTIAVEGKLRTNEAGWVIEATQVQTGCPSKYETVD